MGEGNLLSAFLCIRYLDVISGVMQSYDTNCEFALYDMDWDGVEELIVGYGESNAVLTQHNVFSISKTPGLQQRRSPGSGSSFSSVSSKEGGSLTVSIVAQKQ